MVEYYGWIKLAYDTWGEKEEYLEEPLKEISKKLKDMEFDGRVLILKKINGWNIINLSGFTNHRSEDVNEALQLFELVKNAAKGSYGLLYIHDDEDERYFNNFRVLRLARGELKWFSDPYLSPCIPTIDDGSFPEVSPDAKSDLE